MDVTSMIVGILSTIKNMACSIGRKLNIGGAAQLIFMFLVLCVLACGGIIVVAIYLLLVRKIPLRAIPNTIIAMLSRFAPKQAVMAGLAVIVGGAAFVVATVVGILRPAQKSG